VQDEINGRIFTSGEELAAILLDWFADFPSASHPRHVLFRRNLAAFRELGWHDNWRFAALPVFQAWVLTPNKFILIKIFFPRFLYYARIHL
jgi:hypothetical protein